MRKELIQKLQKLFPNKTKGNTIELDFTDKSIANLTEDEINEVLKNIRTHKAEVDITPDRKDVNVIDELVKYLKRYGINIKNLRNTDVSIKLTDDELSVEIITDNFDKTINNIIEKLRLFRYDKYRVNSVTIIETDENE